MVVFSRENFVFCLLFDSHSLGCKIKQKPQEKLHFSTKNIQKSTNSPIFIEFSYFL